MGKVIRKKLESVILVILMFQLSTIYIATATVLILAGLADFLTLVNGPLGFGLFFFGILLGLIAIYVRVGEIAENDHVEKSSEITR